MSEFRVWQIGPEGTEYYAARSEAEMKDWYRQTMGELECESDLANDFDEVTDLDREFDFLEEGVTRKTTWRKLAEEAAQDGLLPCQLSSGYI